MVSGTQGAGKSTVARLLAEQFARGAWVSADALQSRVVPRPDAVRARERGRGTRLWEQWAWLGEEIESRTQRIGLWLDSSEQTPMQTVEAILARGWTEGVVQAP